MSNIIIPNFGESVNTATISRWHFSQGDTVKRGDVLVTLETDKVASDLEAEEAGVLNISVPEGEDVGIGSVIGFIGESPETVTQERNPALVAQQVAVRNDEKPAEPAPQTETTNTIPSVTTRIEQPKPVPARKTEPVVSDRYTRTRMSKMRRTIAAKLVDVQHQAAILTTFNECDMTAIMALRKQFKANQPEGSTAKLGLMSFFMKAVVHALQEVPQVNARIDGDDLIQNHYYDLSIAIGSDQGLVVPVIRDCDAKGHLQLERELAELAAKARDGKLQLSDLQGGVFTISNGGTYGSMLSTPILNPPQSAILGMHSIMQRPVAKDGEIVIRPMMYLALSYDHRLIDGKQAVTFLIKVKESLENPLLEL